MPAVATKTWAKRAILLGLLLFAGGFFAVAVALQDAFAVVASPDPTNKAGLLADAVMRTERIKSLTRLTSPLGAILFVGGVAMLVFLRLRGPRTARHSDSEYDTADEDDDEAADQSDLNDKRSS